MKESGVSGSIHVCDGCCCGRVEKGHNEVPVDKLKKMWKENSLNNHVKLVISNCLGHCSMHNVTLIKIDNSKKWIGKLRKQEHYDALVELACDISKKTRKAEIPSTLVPHLFLPSEI
tara:strand:- start:459 stop:809 length:351 start_codon:yes stop_codon:yes gene_type:complete